MTEARAEKPVSYFVMTGIGIESQNEIKLKFAGVQAWEVCYNELVSNYYKLLLYFNSLQG